MRNRAYSEQVRAQAMAIVRELYADFGPTLADEKLGEVHSIRICGGNPASLDERRWTLERAGHKPRVFSPRPPRERRGELVQVDGSYHRWFEKRGPEACLLVFEPPSPTACSTKFDGSVTIRRTLLPVWPPPPKFLPQAQSSSRARPRLKPRRPIRKTPAGPLIPATLARLCIAPWSWPCSFSGTRRDSIDLRVGSVMPISEAGTIAATNQGAGRQAHRQEAQHTAGKANDRRAPVAEACRRGTDAAALGDQVEHAREGEQQPGFQGTPSWAGTLPLSAAAAERPGKAQRQLKALGH